MDSGLAAGLNTSPLEILVFLVILSGTTVFWIRSSLARNRAAEAAQVDWADQYFLFLLKRSDLSASEAELAHRLAATQQDPRSRFLVLCDRRAFNSAARMVMERDPEVSPATISALRLHLGLPGAAAGAVPHATGELPVGSPIIVQTAAGASISAVVGKHTMASMILITESSGGGLAGGQGVRLVYRSGAGEFFFPVTVYRHDGEELEVGHSEKFLRRQRRKQFRRKVDLPATIIPLNDPEREYRTALREVGGNGATVDRPEHPFCEGDEVALMLALDPGDSISALARVVRLSGEGSRLHLQFTTIQEQDRDRIYRAIFRS